MFISLVWKVIFCARFAPYDVAFDSGTVKKRRRGRFFASRKISFQKILPRVVFVLLFYSSNALLLLRADSTHTFTTDTDFSLFQKQNVVVAGPAGDGAYLALENRWTSYGVASPARRYWCSLAADTSTMAGGIIFLTGGRNSSSSGGLNDNWIFNFSQNKWTQLSPSGEIPPARYGHNLVSLGGGGRFIVFGGLSSDGYMGDTRIYDAAGNSWTRGNYSVSPSSRAFASAALDTKRNRVYLFGGEDSSGAKNELWYYDIAADSWSYVAQFSTPLARAAAGLVYLKKADTLLLFGGHNSSGQRLGDLWHFSIDAASWTQIIQPSDKPTSRHFHTFIYDDYLDRAVLFGGDAEPSPNIANDLWMYDISSNKWSSAAPLNTPPDGRYGSGAGYIRQEAGGGGHYLFLFGGTGPLAPYGDCWDDTWTYTAASSGSFTTTSVSVSAPTGVIWKNVTLEPTSQPSGTERKFQISVSSDGINWSNFQGPNGDENQFFQYGGSPIPIDYLLWRDRPNLKVKFYLSSPVPPASPSVEKLMVSYNRPPYSPLPIYPPSGKRTNLTSPYFMWQKPADPDGGDTIKFYEIQISASQDFSSVYFSSGGIADSGFDVTSSTPGASLYERKWYWRVRASDGEDYGLWSQSYEFTVDTTPPAAVTNFQGVRGLGNGLIYTSFNVSGDDGNSVYLINANCLVRCATFPLLSESDWSSPSVIEKISPISSLPAGSLYSVDISGLSDGTTYYFNVRIVDQAGNMGALMGVSPSAATNAPPAVSLISVLSGVLSGDVEINWLSSEPDGDNYHLDIYVSSDGVNYSRFNEGASLAPSATFYIMNTKRLRNGDFYRLKITAADEPFGLSSSSISGIFGVSNPNEPPYDVKIASPASGETISGVYTIRWSFKDPNLCDSHITEIYISSDGGNSFRKIGESATYYYILDTALLPNGTFYFIRIKTTDDGVPPLWENSPSVIFSIKNNNLPPAAFSLKEPPDKKSRTALGFYFEWEPSIDPNPSDRVFYRLEYSTSPVFSPSVVVPNLTDTRYYPAATDAMIPGTQDSATYYWRVSAVDSFGEERLCEDNYREFYLLNRARATTDDNRLAVRAVRGLPASGFVAVEEIPYSSQAAPESGYDLLRAADKKTLGDPFLKDISFLSGDGEGMAFRVGFYDAGFKPLAPDGKDVEIEVSYDYTPGASSSGGEFLKSRNSRSQYYVHLRDFIAAYPANIRFASLDEKNSRWIPSPLLPEVSPDVHRIYSVIYSTGYFKLLGALTPFYTLMGLSNYPNPFNPDVEKSRIVYTLTSPSDIKINIYTLAGRLVRSFSFPRGTEGARSQPAGYTNEIFWDGKNDNGITVASGVYILEICAEGDSGEKTKLRRKIAVVRR